MGDVLVVRVAAARVAPVMAPAAANTGRAMGTVRMVTVAVAAATARVVVVTVPASARIGRQWAVTPEPGLASRVLVTTGDAESMAHGK